MVSSDVIDSHLATRAKKKNLFKIFFFKYASAEVMHESVFCLSGTVL